MYNKIIKLLGINIILFVIIGPRPAIMYNINTYMLHVTYTHLYFVFVDCTCKF